jgi:phosphoribosylaminoimidazole synthetase
MSQGSSWAFSERAEATAYASAGVDIDAGNQAVALMRDAVRSTYTSRVLADVGAFGGLFDAADLPANPVLVASTDGVGTKVKLAGEAGQFHTIGQDIVNHCVNDILVQGGRPLFFLDYIASSRLVPEMVAQTVDGIAAACRAAGCVLLGGETAEMPGVYQPGEFDLVGTVVGVVSRDEVLPRQIQPGDVLLGLASSGPHTNGYTLIRRIFANVPLDAEFEDIGALGAALLAPHRCYLPAIDRLHEAGVPIRGLIHITGGGFFDNIPRVLPVGTASVIRRDAWPVPPIFRLIQERGKVSSREMYRVFNMGIGMVVVLPPEAVSEARAAVGDASWPIGEVVDGDRGVILV